MPNDQIPVQTTLDVVFVGIFPSRHKWLGANPVWPPRNVIVCYTNGSRINGLSVSGVFCDKLILGLKFSLGMYASVFQTEIFAIMSCCSSERLSELKDKKFTFVLTVNPL